MFSTPMFYEDADNNYAPWEESERLPKLPANGVRFSQLPATASPHPEIDAADAMEAAASKAQELPPLPPVSSPSTPKWTSADQYREDIRNAPEIKRPTGWKGALQTVGEVALGIMKPRTGAAILHPKYTRQMEEYGRRLDRDAEQMKIDQATEDQARRAAVAEAQMEADRARAETERRQKEHFDWQEKQPLKALPPISVTGPGVYEPSTGEFKQNPYYNPKSEKESEDQATQRRTREADTLGLKGSDRVNYIAGRNVIRTGGRGSDGGGKSMAPGLADKIEASKNKRMSDASAWARAEVKRLKGDPSAAGDAASILAKLKGSKENFHFPTFDTEQEAWDWERQQKQAAQDDYESRIEAATGRPVEHVDLSSAGPSRSAAAPATAAQQATPASRPAQATPASKYKAGDRVMVRDGSVRVIKEIKDNGEVIFEGGQQ